ncbi:hypothetical protein SELMODRAFT_443175 [Selaginella moellendorffii]|uniref:Uncharacterized protein n=1 Tax=Selaginella moellendorffii TaxID=88036 RepID=D8RZ97_SELML|nr:uncharacterized protein LOC9648638 [Selaginella moellendorffii]XP_024537094.1 uncharacterized protein LOC9648638 [Selaginella moellendorffii]EFJ22707.1 hypothetical protein SELMODRAFT_443175 [Selaginella moellendorffii]|eukprot:XP_002976447.1 uncharacterized protein LOC9648638 [Selaginella moellendorffii]
MQAAIRYTDSAGRFHGNQAHANGGTELENGFRDPVEVYDLLAKAEIALTEKVAEANHLRTALQSAQHEIATLKKNAASRKPEEETISQERVPANGNTNAENGADVKSDAVPPFRPDMTLASTRTHEEEVRQLRSKLYEATIRETQLLAENTSLERKMAELQVFYYREQQSVADATSKALTIREELAEKNMKLAYDNQALGQERNFLVTSLLPLLEEFDLHPATDAQSIVVSVKALVQHLKSRVNDERRIKEPGFYRPWLYTPPSPSNVQSPPRFAPPSPLQNGRGLELVPQSIYPQIQRPTSPSSLNVNTTRSVGTPEYMHMQEMVPKHNTDLHENFHSIEGDDPDIRTNYDHKRSPHLPSLPEEPNHAEEDPLPAVAGLRIVGDAVLGSKLTVCGHSINGTALCNFQWIRYYKDGAEDIDGASQTEYTLSADDCETFIAIQCCPMDDRGRKGEEVIEFANNQNIIKCDATMDDQINVHIAAAQAQFDVTVMEDGTEDWEPGTLITKRLSYQIIRNGVRLVKESYTSDVNVRVILGQFIQCAIISSDGKEHMLTFKDNRLRDRAVLTLRRFKQMALEGKRVRSKSWFGKKAG